MFQVSLSTTCTVVRKVMFHKALEAWDGSPRTTSFIVIFLLVDALSEKNPDALDTAVIETRSPSTWELSHHLEYKLMYLDI